jgi:hypothetical protein
MDRTLLAKSGCRTKAIRRSDNPISARDHRLKGYNVAVIKRRNQGLNNPVDARRFLGQAYVWRLATNNGGKKQWASHDFIRFQVSSSGKDSP